MELDIQCHPVRSTLCATFWFLFSRITVFLNTNNLDRLPDLPKRLLISTVARRPGSIKIARSFHPNGREVAFDKFLPFRVIRPPALFSVCAFIWLQHQSPSQSTVSRRVTNFVFQFRLPVSISCSTPEFV